MTELADTAAEKYTRYTSRNAQIAALARASRTDGRDIARPAQEAFMRTFEPGSTYHCNVCGGSHAAGEMANPAQQQRAINSAKTRHYKRLRALRANAIEAAGRAMQVVQVLDGELAELDAQ